MRHRVAFKADFIRIIDHPAAANLRIRVGSETASPIPAQFVGALGNCAPWEATFLDWNAVPGGHIEIFLGFGCESTQLVPDAVSVVQGGSGSDPWKVTEASSALYSGTLAVPNAAAAPLGASQPCREVVVQADGANTVPVLIGGAAAQSLALSAGQAIAIPVSDVATVYVYAAAAGQSVNWIARS